MDIEKQKEIVIHRLKELIIYELNNDGLYDQLNKAGYDMDKRIKNISKNFDGYLHNIFLAVYHYSKDQEHCVLTENKEKNIRRYFEMGYSRNRIAYKTGYNFQIIDKFFEKII